MEVNQFMWFPMLDLSAFEFKAIVQTSFGSAGRPDPRVGPPAERPRGANVLPSRDLSDARVGTAWKK
jgi:hypothetical protein